MVVKVLVVDDSGFFRRRVSEILSSDSNIQVVGTATNGKEAIDQALALKPDVITMDYEMPMMDGITAVRHIMQRCPTPVLMFSSLTHEGARVTLDALDAGAVDFLPKNFEDISRNPEKVKQMLCEKVHSISRSNRRSLFSAPAPAPVTPPPAAPSTFGRPAPAPVARPAVAPVRPAAPTAHSPAPKRKAYKLVAIGTSTGGPVALQRVLTQLPANFPAPIVLIQHMPAAFTKAFAERLDKLCRISVKEAEDGDILRPGLALLAPGGKQMMVDGRGAIKILPGDERLNYKPCVDITFGSAAKSYGDKVLAVVLTGMGADGREGARLLKQGGSAIWAQDEASCVIYGMPMAIVKADLADAVYSLDDIGKPGGGLPLMDVLSLIGIIMAFVAIIGGNYLEGGHLGALANGPAALIVIGGTVGAALLQSPMSSFKRAMQILIWIIFPPRVDLPGGIDRVVNWSLTARKEGLLGLEGVADAEPDSYARKGLQLLVDGAEPEAIRSILEVDFYTQESRDINAAKVFESMGGYAPTIGIIGAVMGLIHVMGNLADPSQLGSGIAVAFVATIYGVASANLALLPVASKLKSIAMRQSRYREMLLEGILSIAEGENPRSIELKLQGFMD